MLDQKTAYGNDQQRFDTIPNTVLCVILPVAFHLQVTNLFIW